MVWLAAVMLACGNEPGAEPSTEGGSAGSEGNVTGGMTPNGGGSSAGTSGTGGQYVVPNQDFCAEGDGEVLAVDVAVPELALGDGHLYVLASLGDVSGASLELYRVPLPKGRSELLSAQALYGFDLGVQGGVVGWGTREELPIQIDEDYADFDGWTLDTSAGEASRLIQGGVMKHSFAPAGAVVSRFEPPRLELHSAEGVTALCPATAVNALLTNTEVALWHNYRTLTVCPLDGGEAIAIDLNGETGPEDLQLDGEYAYWRFGGQPGLWRAPLTGGTPELVLPELDGDIVRVDEQRAFVVPTDGARIDMIDLASGVSKTVASSEGRIGVLVADASHVYFADYMGQWICVKSVALSPVD